MKKTIGIIIVLVFVLILGNAAFVETKQNEYKVVRQFGKIVSIQETAGLSMKVPLISTVTSISKAIQLYDLPASDVITSDKKTMYVDCYVLWQITDARKFIQTLNGNVSNAEARIDTIVYNALKNNISKMTQDQVIQSRDTKESNLTDQIMTSIGDISSYGFDIKTVDIKVLDLPDENKQAVYERMIAERNNIAAQYTAKGDSEAQIIRNDADKNVSVMLSEAKSKAEIIIAEGEAEYMKILSEAYNDEDKADFYLFVRSLDALKNTMKGDKTLIVDSDSPIGQLFSAE